MLEYQIGTKSKAFALHTFCILFAYFLKNIYVQKIFLKKNTLGGLVFRSFLPHLTPDRDERRRREKEEEHATQRHTKDTQTLSLSITYKKT